MLTSFKQRKHMFVFEQSGDQYPIGLLVDFVVNPDQGKIEALWLKTGFGLRLLATKDILKWTSQKIVISSENDLMEPEDAPKLRGIMEKEVQIIHAKVFTSEHKMYLGKVIDFSFDTMSPRILSIIVRGGFLGFGTSRIIAHTKIEKITSEGIFILENKIKTEDPVDDPLLDLEKTKIPEVDGPQ